MQTTFCVGYSGKLDDLKRIIAASSKVKSVYAGGLMDKIGGARPSFFESWEQLSSQIDYAHKNGVAYHIALNASTGIPSKFDRNWWKDTSEYLKKMEKLGVDGVIVAHPMLMRQVKEHTDLLLTVSTVCDVTTARGALSFEKLGADVIVPSMNANMKVDELRLMAKSLKKAKLRIMVNERCLGDCVYRRFHFDTYSGITRNTKNEGDQYYLNCHTMYYRTPHLLLANNAIRPEDIQYYKDITSDFKIVGRLASIDDQIERVKAYDRESFEGNYIQLILSQFTSKIEIPNPGLEGLIQKKWECDKICDDCGYCEELFKRIGRVQH